MQILKKNEKPKNGLYVLFFRTWAKMEQDASE